MTKTILCSTLVPEKLYPILHWGKAISNLKNFDGDMYITLSKKGSIYEKGNDYQIIDDHNKLRDICIERKADMFIVDIDTIPPEDAFIKLNKGHADIMAGIVKNPIDYNAFYRDETKTQGIPVKNANLKPNTGIKKVDAVGFGCVLIRNKVLEKILFTSVYRGRQYLKGHDLVYCLSAKDIGFKVMAHTDVVCKHYRMYMDGWIDDFQTKITVPITNDYETEVEFNVKTIT